MALLIKFIALPLYPVGLVFVLGVIGIIYLFKSMRTAKFFIIASISTLFLFSSPVVAHFLINALEKPFYSKQVPAKSCPAIVILGGSGESMGKPRLFPEINRAGDRILHGLRLFKMGLAPLIITTGTQFGVFGKSVPEAVHNATLLYELGVDSTKIIRETGARNTHEHAPNIITILDSLHLPHEIILVTSASHMNRSVKVFEKYGYTVYPAATDFVGRLHIFNNIHDFFPTADALEVSTAAIHEYYGAIAYRILGWL